MGEEERHGNTTPCFTREQTALFSKNQVQKHKQCLSHLITAVVSFAPSHLSYIFLNGLQNNASFIKDNWKWKQGCFCVCVHFKLLTKCKWVYKLCSIKHTSGYYIFCVCDPNVLLCGLNEATADHRDIRLSVTERISLLLMWPLWYLGLQNWINCLGTVAHFPLLCFPLRLGSSCKIPQRNAYVCASKSLNVWVEYIAETQKTREKWTECVENNIIKKISVWFRDKQQSRIKTLQDHFHSPRALRWKLSVASEMGKLLLAPYSHK